MYIDEYPLCSIFTALFPADPQSRPRRKARHAQLHSNHDSDNGTEMEKKDFDNSYVISRKKKSDVPFLVRFVVHIDRNLENRTGLSLSLSLDLDRRGSIINKANTRRRREKIYVVPGILTSCSCPSRSLCRVRPFLLNIISPSCCIFLQLFTFSTAESTYRIHRTIPLLAKVTLFFSVFLFVREEILSCF